MSDNSIYAKAYRENGQNKTETLEDHTKELLQNFEIIKSYYSNEIDNSNVENIWELLKLACIYHDLGKVSDQFQKKIRDVAKKQTIKVEPEFKKEIPHNYLSPAFFSFIKGLKDNELRILFFAVAYHHDRNINFDNEYLQEIINKDLMGKIKKLDWLKEFNLEPNAKLWGNYYQYLKDPSKFKAIKNNSDFILLKGLLHRLDHSASAHFPVEEERIKDTKNLLLKHIKDKTKGKFDKLKDFQENAENYRDKSVMLTASTSIPFFRTKNKIDHELPIDKKNQIFVLRVKYDRDIGIIFENSLENFVEFL